METNINLYASKISTEHPISVWPLDSVDAFAMSAISKQYYKSDKPANIYGDIDYGLPLVYGSKNSLRLLHTDTDDDYVVKDIRPWIDARYDPDVGTETTWRRWLTTDYDNLRWEDSYVVPMSSPSVRYHAYGMFTEVGKYNTYTAEMWIRIEAHTKRAKKIWGSSNTLDGLWINDNFLTLVVGKHNKSYAIENWYRPMLINVTYTPTNCRLLINGEEVISLIYNAKDLLFVDDDGNDIDDLVFIADDTFGLFEIDCFSLFPYVLPNDVLRRHFVWGQGVGDIKQFSSSYETKFGFIDYSFANYANNIIYPDLTPWDSGYKSGFETTTKSLVSPNYQLPEINVQGRNIDDLYVENLYRNDTDNALDRPFFTFRPEYDWDQPSYFRWNKLQNTDTPIQIFYGVFEQWSALDNTEEKPLVVFSKISDGQQVRISVDGTNVYYKLNDEVFHSFAIEEDKPFSVGFDLNKVFNGSNYALRNFFLNLGDIECFVGGDGNKTFPNKIYAIGFADTDNAVRNALPSYFDENGIVMPDQLFETTYATYTLIPKIQYGEFYLDVAADLYWEEAVALDVLGKNLRKDQFTIEPRLDYLQINYGYDGHYKILSIPDEGDYFDFTSAELRTWVTFQKLGEKERPLRDFSPKFLRVTKVVEPTENWENERYEVMNGTVVYPPSDVDYDQLKMIVYFTAKTSGVINSPFAIKRLQIAGQVFEGTMKDKQGNEVECANIMTRTGSIIKAADPVAIYKENTPTLYLSKDSGLEPRNGGSFLFTFNDEKAAYCPLAMVNFFMRPNYEDFVNEVLVEIVNGDRKYYFKRMPDSNKSFHLVDENGDSVRNCTLYVNGQPGEIIPILDNQWVSVGIEFAEPLRAGGKVVDIWFNSGAVYQNISVTKVTIDQVFSTAIVRKWSKVKEKTWTQWQTETDTDSKPYTYSTLLSDSSFLEYPVPPSEIYDIYTGTNHNVVDDGYVLGGSDTFGHHISKIDWEGYDRKPN
jgi:hypothetical protein